MYFETYDIIIFGQMVASAVREGLTFEAIIVNEEIYRIKYTGGF